MGTSDEPRILAAGIDSLKLSYYGTVAPEWATKLTEAQEDWRARPGGDPPVIRLAGDDWTVKGSAGGFAWFAYNAWGRIHASPTQLGNRPAIQIEPNASALWESSSGAVVASSMIAAELRGGRSDPRDEQVSRVDLTVDVGGATGLLKSEADYVTRAVLTRRLRAEKARAKEGPPRYADELPGEVWGVHRRPGSIYFGRRGVIRGCIYDKRMLTAADGSLAWWRSEVWGGWDGPVTRVEFSLGREGVKQLFDAPTTWASVDTGWRAAWDYLTSTYLRHVERTHARLRECPTSKVWEVVQKASRGEVGARRSTLQRGDARRLVVQALGCLRGAAELEGVTWQTRAELLSYMETWMERLEAQGVSLRPPQRSPRKMQARKRGVHLKE